MTKEDIIKLRAELGITQDQLAEKVGLKLRTIQNYESGATSPNAKTIMKMVALRTQNVSLNDSTGNLMDELPKDEIEALKKKFDGVSNVDLINYIRLNQKELLDHVSFRKFINKIAYKRLKEIVDNELGATL